MQAHETIETSNNPHACHNINVNCKLNVTLESEQETFWMKELLLFAL